MPRLGTHYCESHLFLVNDYVVATTVGLQPSDGLGWGAIASV